MKNLNTKIEEIITNTLEKRQTEILKLKDNIRVKAEKAKDLEQKIKELTLNGADEDYIRVKRELDDTLMVKKLNEDRLSALMNKPLVSPDEQKKILDQLNDKFNAVKLDAEKKMGELAEKMYDIARELSEQTAVLSEISLKYQREICKRDGYDLEYYDAAEAIQWGLNAVIDHQGLFTEGTGRKYVQQNIANPYDGKIVPYDEWAEGEQRRREEHAAGRQKYIEERAAASQDKDLNSGKNIQQQTSKA